MARAVACGSPLAPTEAARAPDIPGLSIGSLVGRGGFADVWQASDNRVKSRAEGRAIGRAGPWVVKVARDLQARRMEREIAIASALAPPTVPAFIDHGHTRLGHRFMTMEYLRDSLAERLAPAPARTDAHSLATPFVALCQAVGQIHESGVVHRDLKPENVFFRSDSQVALIDFGLAAARGERAPVVAASAEVRTATGQALGTGLYMAPEQWADASRVDVRSDVYALGVILFEWLTGRPPFMGNPGAVRRGHRFRRCPRPSECDSGARVNTPAIGAALDRIVLRALAKDPAERFATTRDLASAFTRALTGQHRSVAAQVDRSVSTTPEAMPEATTDDDARPTRPNARRDSAGSALDVALLHAHGGVDARALTAYAHAHDAVFASITGSGQILAFPQAGSVRASVRAAVRAAQSNALWSRVQPRLIHVAPVSAHFTSRGIKLCGSALRRDAGWLQSPPGLGDRVLLTDTAASYARGIRPLKADARWFELVATAPLDPLDAYRVQFRGHVALLDDLVASASAAMATGTPRAWQLVGAPGVGKTRILTELARRIRATARAGELAPYALSFSCDDPRITHPDQLVRALLCASLDADAADDLAALRHELSEFFSVSPHDGQAPDDAMRDAAMWLLGDHIAPASRPSNQALAPATLRRHIARALAHIWLTRARVRPFLLLLDDVYRADRTVHEAVERAVQTESPARLVVIATSRDQPSVGSNEPARTHTSTILKEPAFTRRTLPPLNRTDAGLLIAELIQPVEFLSSEIVERLYRLTGGVPLFLVELVRTLRERGAIRKHSHNAGWFLDAEELPGPDEVAEFGPRAGLLSAHLRAALPDSLWALAQLCAVLGQGFSAADLQGVHAVWRSSRASTSPAQRTGITADDLLQQQELSVGAQRLVRRGVLAGNLASLHFRHRSLAHAIESAMTVSDTRAWHAAAFQYGQRARWPDVRMVRHASRAGLAAEATGLRLQVARTADAEHRYVAAERLYARVLDSGTAHPEQRIQALSGRARMRYRLQRMDEALRDVRSAVALAESVQRPRRAALLRFEEAKILDWLHEFEASAQVAERASVQVSAWRGQAGAPTMAELIMNADLATGRSHYRRGEFSAAVTALDRAADRARLAGESEPLIIALLLLAPALVSLHKLDHAERRFDEVIAACEQSGDDFHRAVAYMNRSTLWSRRNDPDKLMADMRLCRELGQQLGHAQIVRLADYNLAETRYWCGDFERAEELARRARDLQLRFFASHQYHEETLLCARIACARRSDVARTMLAWLDDKCEASALGAGDRVLLAMVEAALATVAPAESSAAASFDAQRWRALCERAEREATIEVHMEVATTAAEVAHTVGDSQQARDWLARSRSLSVPLWASRLENLERKLNRE